MSGPRVLTTAPSDMAFDRFVELAPNARQPVESLEEELQRYPAGTPLPRVVLAGSASLDGHEVRARYASGFDTAVLTPQFDLRGNLHRVVAASLLRANGRESEVLQRDWGNANGPLYGGRLGPEEERAALIAAVFTNRPTIDVAAATNPELLRRVRLVSTFLNSVGLGVSARSPAPPSPFGYLTSTTGRYPSYALRPGEVAIDLAPPVRPDDSHSFTTVAASESDSIIQGLVRDCWVLPEALLSEAVEQICVVEDVREGHRDFAGYASGRNGERSTLVIERERRRGILFHELGHALHFRFDEHFPTEEWLAVTSEDEYFGDAREFIDLGVRQPDYDPELLARGFITSYGSSTIKEDVAELCKAVFTGDVRLWASLGASPAVARKVELLEGFLQQADPLLTPEFLRELAADRHVQERAWGAS